MVNTKSPSIWLTAFHNYYDLFVLTDYKDSISLGHAPTFISRLKMLMLFFSFCLLRYYFIKMSFMHYYIIMYKSYIYLCLLLILWKHSCLHLLNVFFVLVFMWSTLSRACVWNVLDKYIWLDLHWLKYWLKYNNRLDTHDIIIIHVVSFIRIRADQLLVNMFV